MRPCYNTSKISDLIQIPARFFLPYFIACFIAFNSWGQVKKSQLIVGGLMNVSKEKNYVIFDMVYRPSDSYTTTLNSWKINPDVLVTYGLSSKLHLGIGFQYSFRQDQTKVETTMGISEGTPQIAQSFAVGPLLRYYIVNRNFGVFTQFQKSWGKQSISQNFFYSGYNIKKGTVNIFQAGIGGYYCVNQNVNVELMISYRNDLINMIRRIDEGHSVRITKITDKNEKIILHIGTTFLINTKRK